MGLNGYFLRSVRCVSADPADVFADLLELEFFSTFEAAVAAFVDVTFTGDFACERAEPAADFADLLESLLRRIFEAALAARLLVTSGFLAILSSLHLVFDFRTNLYRRVVI